MIVPTLFSVGFSATAMSTSPAPTIIVLIVAYALLTGGTQPLPLSLAIFTGAFCASLLGKPGAWRRPAMPTWMPVLLTVVYGAQLKLTTVESAESTAVLLIALIFEHQLLEHDVLFAKLLCHVAALSLCLLLDPPGGGNVGTITHIYCTLAVVAGCWFFSYGRGVMATLRNALSWTQ